MSLTAQEDGDEVLQQQNADNDCTRALVVEHRGRQQLEADDGARKHHATAYQQ
jgi:hypothetical protein